MAREAILGEDRLHIAREIDRLRRRRIADGCTEHNYDEQDRCPRPHECQHIGYRVSGFGYRKIQLDLSRTLIPDTRNPIPETRSLIRRRNGVSVATSAAVRFGATNVWVEKVVVDRPAVPIKGTVSCLTAQPPRDPAM
jgi:hypothetical protein